MISTARMVQRIEIALATAADVPGITGIEVDAFSDPWSEQSFREALRHGHIYFACAKRSDAPAVLGYVVAWFVADQGEIANLAVSAADRGRGIGKALLDAALAEARARGADEIFLEVRNSNAPARALYGSRGFKEVGRRPNYYRRPVEDAIVLRRTLK
jgi:ribosomal-protein-alanine N-acetyltransferase